MTMHLVRGLNSSSTKRRKQVVTKKQQELLVTINSDRERNKLPTLSTLAAAKRMSNDFKPLRIDNGPRRAGSMSYQNLTSKHDTAHVASVRSVMDPMALAREKPEVREAIIAKSHRIAPAYSKGAYQYVTDEADISDLGRKK